MNLLTLEYIVVARTDVGRAWVSTVSHGYDLSHGRNPNGLWWETVVRWPGHPMDDTYRRYETRSDAVVGHAAMVLEVETAQRAPADCVTS